MSTKNDAKMAFKAKADNGAIVHVYKRYSIKSEKFIYVVVGRDKFNQSWLIGPRHWLYALGYRYGWNIHPDGYRNESLGYWTKRKVNDKTINELL